MSELGYAALKIPHNTPLESALVGVGGKPWVATDQFIDTSVLPELHTEIVRGMSISEQSTLSPGFEYTRGDAALALYDKKFKCVGQALLELRPDEMEFYNSLNMRQQHRYLKIAKGAYFPWSSAYILVASNWNTKQDPTGKAPSLEAKRLFPKTLEWVYSLPIFKSIGRVTIFGVDPNHHITCHRDLDPRSFPNDCELLMIDPLGNKPFYVYDASTGEKHYVKGTKTFVFHEFDYHGVDALPYFTYNFRIDGYYTDEFRKAIKFGRVAPASAAQKPPELKKTPVRGRRRTPVGRA